MTINSVELEISRLFDAL